MKTPFNLLALCGLSGLFLAPAALGQDFSAWSKHKEIKLNTSASGANIATALAKYPVPILLTAANFDFEQAKADGSDLRFSMADGSPLAHELERWDKAGKTAALWVKADLLANSASQAIRMHWGNPAAATASDPKAVFAPADGWVAAWHLGEDAAVVEDGFKDATGVNHGTGHNLAAGSAIAARFGFGTDLKHTLNQGVKIQKTRKNFDLTANVTFEMWAYVRSWAYNRGYETFMCKGDASWRYMRAGTAQGTEICSDGMSPACLFSKTNVGGNFNKWYHFAGVHEGRGVKLFVNGVREDMRNAGADHASTGDYAVTLGFSLHQGNQQRFVDVIMDEARISKLSKSDDWIKLDYESGKEGSTFAVHGEATTSLRRNAYPGWIGPSPRLAGPRSAALAAFAGADGLRFDARGRSLPSAAPSLPASSVR